MSESCKSCHFFRSIKVFGNLTTKNGFCKRYPPKDIEKSLSDFKLDKIRYPIINEEEWCGEYAEIIKSNLRINEDVI